MTIITPMALTSPVQQRLTGDWRVRAIPLDADPFEECLSDTWRVVPECCHLQLALYPGQPYWGEHLRSINRQAWIYERTFSLPNITYQRARLRFEGVDYFASVWLNDQYIGNHEGNFAPFEFDITHALRRNSDNRLIVRVTAPWDQPNTHGTYPIDHVKRGLVKGLYEHGEGVIPPDINPIGIWRPIWLIVDNGASPDHVRIRTQNDGTIDLRFTVANSTRYPWQGKIDLHVTPENHDGLGVDSTQHITIRPGVQPVNITLKIPEPRLWWSWDQGLPNLYRLSAHLLDIQGQDHGTVSEIFGLRHIRLERSPKQFVYWLNERPVFIRGTSYIPTIYLSRCSTDMLQSDLKMVRDLNLNLLRVHVHVSPPLLYDLCDRAGIMVWQDFELNWIHDPSLEFENRARHIQREMIDLLGNHPSIVTWACHNEPTMLYSRRDNLEKHPAPALYADVLDQDNSRPVFLCSGQNEEDWQRSGDTHSYYGAIWTNRYTDVYDHTFRLNTEFGIEAPPSTTTLQAYPEVWERLKHLEPEIDELWNYQAQLIQYHIEHFRRLRAQGCGGYIHFWLVDLAPQVGWGVLDVCRHKKGGYAVLKHASQPLHIALEHDGQHPYALWVFNDTPSAHIKCTAECRIFDEGGNLLFEESSSIDLAANKSIRVCDTRWAVPTVSCHEVELVLRDQYGTILARNKYKQPFRRISRPQGYPWKFDPLLGCKVFDLPDAPSLADQSKNPILKLIPLAVRESVAERILRQQLSARLLSIIAHFVDFLNT